MEASRRLGGTDSLMWNIEVDPVLRSPILAMAVLDEAPDWDAVLHIAETAVVGFPRLRQRVSGRRWVDVPDFALTDHVRRVRLPAAGSLRALLDFAQPTAAAAFDAARPPWAWTFVEGLDRGRCGFILRVHHTVTDGVGGIGLAGSLLFEAADRAPAPAPPPVPAPSPTLLGQVASLPAGAARLAASLARELAPAGAPLSPIMRGRSLRRALDTLDVPLDRLLAAGHSQEATLNDAFLAAVAGGMQRYHERNAAPVDALRFTMPVSIRLPTDPAGGNRFAPARFVLPLGGGPVERVAAARREAGRARSEPALPATTAIAGVFDLLPPRLSAAVVGSMFKTVDVDAVDVPGLGGTVRLAGTRVRRLYAFAPPTGAAVSVTLLSHGRTACVGIECDRAAVTDPSLLTQCLADSFLEVLDLAPAPRAAKATKRTVVSA